MRPLARLSLLGAWLGALGCADNDAPAHEPSDEARPAPLALPDDWQRVAPEDDPLITEASEVPDCTGPGFWIERELD